MAAKLSKSRQTRKIVGTNFRIIVVRDSKDNWTDPLEKFWEDKGLKNFTR